MNYLSIPGFLGVTWMALILMRMEGPFGNRRLRLWVTGLGFIQVEAVARFMYALHGGRPVLHELAHALALCSYFLAGVAFLRSSAGSASVVAVGRRYLMLASLPHLALLTAYAAGVHAAGFYYGLAACALLGTPWLARRYGKPRVEVWTQAGIWVALLLSVTISVRLAVYTSLAIVFALAALGFAVRLRGESRGRMVIVTSFGLWSLCFVVHPWLAEHRAAWVPMLSEVWDLQRYLVTFGVLICALEERVAINEHLALHDDLTGLANRNLFRSKLQSAMARSRRRGSRVLLLNLDMSGFKQVNDTWGHPAGDELLRQIGQRLLNATRETDTVARLGGDEFAVVLEEIDGSLGSADRAEAISVRAEVLTRKIRSAIELRQFAVPGAEGDVPLSLEVAIGAAIFPDEADTADEMHRVSDDNMYRDKRRLREFAGPVPAGLR